MDYKRLPIYKFDDENSTGINTVPIGSMVLINEELLYLSKVRENLTDITTIKEAIELGALGSKTYNTNVWDLIYYADEEDDRILGMNIKTMQAENIVGLTEHAHAGSCDRAGDTHKMYVRTAGHYWVEVIDLTTGKWLKKIPLHRNPRSSGAFNKYRRFHAICTKTDPWTAIIDIDTDTVVIEVGSDGGSPHGNDGGNATGHAVWLDADHFAMLDRHNKNIQIYKINEDSPPYTTTLTQTIPTPTGVHSLRSAEAGHLFQDRVFFAAIEGSRASVDNVPPEMWKMTFDSSTGTFDLGTRQTVTFPGAGVDWRIHHFGVDKVNNEIAVPIADTTSNNATVYILDIATWAVSGTTYPAKMGAGHADYSADLNTWVITNHYSTDVTIIDRNTNNVYNVSMSSEPESWGHMIQSHANHIVDGYYYCFESINGIFVEIDIANHTVTRQTVTGGKPVQSFS